MKKWGLAALVLVPSGADQRYFSFERSVAVRAAGRSCAVLDPEIYTRANAGLTDLRLYGADGMEVPYVTTISESAQGPPERAGVANVAVRQGRISFELSMPARRYTEVRLELDAQNFVGTAQVTGLRATGEARGVALGTFSVFDLTGERLSRSTVLALPESAYPVLRVVLDLKSAPGRPPQGLAASVVEGATVPQSREAQTLYTTVAESAAIGQHGKETTATLGVPARVPVERLLFVLEPGSTANFSRSVLLTAHAPGSTPEGITGEIARVQMRVPPVDVRRLSVPAVLAANRRAAAEVDIAVTNGEDAPIPLATVQLQMRRRELCFDASAAGELRLFYGDAGRKAPAYEYARTFNAAEPAGEARLGTEQKNADFLARAGERIGYGRRHPEWMWVALLGGVGVLALVAFRRWQSVL